MVRKESNKPLILCTFLHVDLINIAYLMACAFYQVIMMLHFSNNIANDVEMARKIDHYVITSSLKTKPTCKLINRIPSKSFCYHVFQAQLREHMINDSECLVIQQGFSKPCLVNLISKDTHLIFSTYVYNLVPKF